METLVGFRSYGFYWRSACWTRWFNTGERLDLAGPAGLTGTPGASGTCYEEFLAFITGGEHTGVSGVGDSWRAGRAPVAVARAD
jgi:hypothetical protein